MAKKKIAPIPATEHTLSGPFKIVPVPGDDMPTYYVNNVNIDLSSFDVRFRLGQIQGVNSGNLQVKEVAHVFMSHAHFNALVDAVNSSATKLDKLPPVTRANKDDSSK